MSKEMVIEETPEEISDEVFAMSESEFKQLAQPLLILSSGSEERRKTILQMALLDEMARDSADFVTEGLAKGLLGVVDTMLSLGKPDGEPPKRTY